MFEIPASLNEERGCDFCSGDVPAVVAYPARSVRTRIGVFVYSTEERTDWLACERCHLLIAAGRREDLHRRGADTGLAKLPRSQRRDPGLRKSLERTRRDMHDNFWAAREGPPRPLYPRST